MDVKRVELVEKYLKEKVAEQDKCPAEVCREDERILIRSRKNGQNFAIGFDVNGCMAETIINGTMEEKEQMGTEIMQILSNAGEMRNVVTEITGMKYEDAKKHLIMRPLRYMPESPDLADVPQLLIGDIVLALYALVCGNEGCCCSTRISRDMVKGWKVDEREAIRDAFRNMLQLHPARMYTRAEIMESTVMPATAGLLDQVKKGERGYILTNDPGINGAASVFCPGVAEKIAKALEEDFYFVCTSIHEVQVHALGAVSPDVIGKALRDTNGLCNKADQVLSDRVYRYNRDSRTFSVQDDGGFVEAPFRLAAGTGWEDFSMDER